MSEPAVTPRPHPVPGDGLLHPLVLLAIGLLVLNDHLLKEAWPGAVTGKLSDFAGLFFFPLLLQALWEVGTAALGRPSQASRKVLLVSIVMTGVVFSAVQLVPVAGDTYRYGLGSLQWLAGLLPGAFLDRPYTATPVPVLLTPDPTDLIALPMLVVAYVIGARRAIGRVR